jgi:Zn-dependent protease with chaperone function
VISATDRAFLRAVALPTAVVGLSIGALSTAITLAFVPDSQALWACLLRPIIAGHLLLHLGIVFGGGALLITLIHELTHWHGYRARFTDTTELGANAIPTSSIFGLELLLHRLGVQRQTHLVIGDQPTAFVRGFLRPSIYLSTGLVAILTLEELEAVILHERWHALRRDPLRLAIVKVMTHPFRSLVNVQEMVFRHALAIEVEADHYVIQRMQTSRWVAAALLRLVNNYERRPELAFASLIDSRIAALAGEKIPQVERLSAGETLLLALGSLGFCVVLMSFFGITWPFC